MADVLEVLIHRIKDVDGAEVHSQLLAEDGGVCLGADGGTEAGHGHGDDVGAGSFQKIHGADHDQKGQGGVQTARDAQDQLLGPGGGDTLLQTVCLNGQDALTMRGAEGRVGGEEGMGIHGAGQLGVLHAEVKVILDAMPAGRGVEASHAAVVDQTLQIQLGDGQSTAREGLILGQDFTALTDEVVAAENAVGSGLALPRLGQDIAAQGGGGAGGSGQHTGLLRAHDLGGGRGVADHHRTRRDGLHGGRDGGVLILSHLHGKAEGRQRGADEELLDPHLDEAAVPQNVGDQHLGGGSREGTAFGGGQVGLGHKPRHRSATDHGGAVVQLISQGHGQADHRDQIQMGGLFGKGLQSLLGACDETVVGVEIPAGRPRETQLGEHQKLDTQSGGLLGQSHTGGGVMGWVGHADGGGSGGDLDESVLHNILSFRHRLTEASYTRYIPYHYSRK